MASTCEEALDRLIDSCQTYRHQCEDYRNKTISGQLVIYTSGSVNTVLLCTPEFRVQLDTVLSLLVGLAPQVLKAITSQHMTRWERERQVLEDSHQQTMEGMAKEKVI